MNPFFYLIFLFLFFVLCMGSITITILDLINDRYFKELNNIKSLNNKEEYMDVDYLLIKQTIDRDVISEGAAKFDISGVLISDKSTLKLSVIYSKYIDFNLEYQPLYKSKLTGCYFLKDAPKVYYEGKLRECYFGVILKIVFYPIIFFILYRCTKYIKNRKYRL